MRVFIKTFGCSSNRAETASLECLLRDRGFQITDGATPADAVVINTCTVRRDTELRVMRYISSMTGKKVVVTGCMAEVQPSTIASAFPGASIVSPHNLQMVAEALSREGRTIAMEHSTAPLDPSPYGRGVRHVVAISRGCYGRCTYCIVRLAKGSLASVQNEKILQSVSSAVRGGAKEILLSAQDTGAYGSDIGGNLPDLLDSITGLGGDFRVRVGMFGPASVTPFLGRLVRSYDSEKIYKFAHIPVQSGSDAVLEAMGRGYTTGDFYRILSSMKSSHPNMTLFTDVMVGFPGETEEDFADTCRLVEEARPDKTHVARFSPRPHTPASARRQIPEEVKKRRSSVLTELSRRVQLDLNSRWIGREVCAMVVDDFLRGGMIARTGEYKTVAIPGLERSRLGERVSVSIRSANPSFLTGELSRR